MLPMVSSPRWAKIHNFARHLSYARSQPLHVRGFGLLADNTERIIQEALDPHGRDKARGVLSRGRLDAGLQTLRPSVFAHSDTRRAPHRAADLASPRPRPPPRAEENSTLHLLVWERNTARETLARSALPLCRIVAQIVAARPTAAQTVQHLPCGLGPSDLWLVSAPPLIARIRAQRLR